MLSSPLLLLSMHSVHVQVHHITQMSRQICPCLYKEQNVVLQILLIRSPEACEHLPASQAELEGGGGAG